MRSPPHAVRRSSIWKVGYFVIRCPFDINIGFTRDEKGKPVLRNLSGEASAIRASKLGEKLHITNEVEWRRPEVPTIQLSLPYVFIADEPVYMSQVAPFMHYAREPFRGRSLEVGFRSTSGRAR